MMKKVKKKRWRKRKKKNPRYPHVAVAEKGENPLIIIYEWPSMDRVCILRGGTEKSFASLNYSPDGEHLCSQGGDPDYFLTVWNWKRARIVRQQKAYGQDVFNAMFSQYARGNLTTAGYGHIKFWKLARTFTGLKLMGSIGRFGKTEMCDIVGFVALPDEQVISGCEWGNMLIWSEGLVKAEISRKNDLPCHEGYISQLLYDELNEEIITVGTDGFVRAWDFKLIEKADLSGEEQKIKIEILHSLEVGKGPQKSQLLYIEKQEPDPDKSLWFAQDGNGGIWLIDLDQDHPKPSEKLFSCHAGKVRCIAASPTEPYLASYGEDGRLIFYNYFKKKTIMIHKFAAGGGFMIWPSTDIDPSGSVLICGGADGILRVVVVALEEKELNIDTPDGEYLKLIQTTKPHTMRITYIAAHRSRQVLVTGSEDATIFVYQIAYAGDYLSLHPIGFVRLPSAITYMVWKHTDRPMLLLSCFGGEIVEMEVPDIPSPYTKTSFELTHVEPYVLEFVSVKSQIRRDLYLEEVARNKREKVEMKKKKLEEMKKENPNVKIDEAIFLEDTDSSISLESLYFPEVPNPILFAMYLPNKAIWVSPGGYDAGYMYVYKIGWEDPIRCKMIADADDIEIHSYVYDPTGEYIILGMQNGRIRVCRINPSDYSDLSNYWELALHDNDNGIIPQMCYSYDKKLLFTCGHDGNIFAFTVTSEKYKTAMTPYRKKAPWPTDELEDVSTEETYSLEQLKDKAELDRQQKVADGHKEEMLGILKGYKDKFAVLLDKNEALPVKVKVPYGDFIIDHRIEDNLEEELEDRLKLEKRKLAFQAEKSALSLKKVQDYFYNCLDSQLVAIHGINDKSLKAYTFRSKVLPPEFFRAKEFIEERLEQTQKSFRAAPQRMSKFFAHAPAAKPLPLASWLKGLSTMGTNVKMNVKLQRMLLKYYDRKRKQEMRQEQWNEMMKMKPDPKVSHPQDIGAIILAEKTIGDYKMKTDPNYAVLKRERITTDTKFQQLLMAREKLFNLQKEYNDRVYKLRDKKIALIQHITELHEELRQRQEEIPEEDRKVPPPIPEFDPDEEFAELALTLREEDVLAQYPPEDTRKVRSSFELLDDEDEEVEQDQSSESSGSSSEDEDEECLDSDYEVLLTDPRAPAPVKSKKVDSSLYKRKKFPKKYSAGQFFSDIKLHDYIAKSGDDHRDTAWEKEMKFRRLCSSLFIQDQIILEIEDKIEEFDKELTVIKDDRFKVAVDVKFGELHLLKIHQEIIILKDYEAMEDTLATRVHTTQIDIHGLETKISDTEHRIEQHQKEIEHLSEREKQLLAVFNETIEDNPYADFLRKIYKKKYKPPKEKRGEDGSSSSSSSESESSSEEDEESGDSDDIGIIKLDESICPPDLARDIYDMTFKLRSERHSVEIRTTEEKKQIEGLKKDIEFEFKKIKVLEKNLEKQKAELLDFQREKQHRLNEVLCVVALKASQLQYFEDPNADLIHMDDKLVFSYKMLGSLTNRVGELHKETVMQKTMLRRYKRHHFRMSVDCRQMQFVINELKADINDILIKKFGSILKIDELEDILLQRLVNEMKSPLQDIKDEFHRAAGILKAEIRKKQNLLSIAYVNTSEKINVLTILENEKYNLNLLVAKQEIAKENVTYRDLFQDAEELKKLTRMVKNQETQINSLKEEVRNLSFKGKPPPPICTTPMIQEALRKAKLLAMEPEEIVEIPDEEEDEDMFLYMESADAVQLLADRSSLDDMKRLPSPQYILEDLLHRISFRDLHVEVAQVLDVAIEELINKIPLTDEATCILDEVLELLATRLTSIPDPKGLKEVLYNMVHDLESLPTAPSQVRLLFQSVFDKVKEKEAEIESALHARAVVYDILRKCVGFVLGRKFFLSTEEAMLQVLSALDPSEMGTVVEEILSELAKQFDEYAGQPVVQEVLDDVIHHLHSLASHEHPKTIFSEIFNRLRTRLEPEKDVAVARHVLHDVLKKAIGVLADTLHPITEREFLEVHTAIDMILQEASSVPDTVPFFDEIELQLQNRDAEQDAPDTKNLIQLFSEGITERPPMEGKDLVPYFKKLLGEFESSSASSIDKFKAYAVVYDVLRRTVLFVYPDIELSDIHRLVDPAAITLSLLDKIPSDVDTTQLYEDVLEELNEKNKEELFSEAVQNMLPKMLRNLENVQNKERGIKNSFAAIADAVKETKTFKYSITSVLKMLLDATRDSMDLLFPNLGLEEDEDVRKSQQQIITVSKHIEPDTYPSFLLCLGDVLEEWQPKRTDPPEVSERIKEIIQYLRTAPEPKRIKRTMSYIFKMVNKKSPTKDIVLRILFVLKFGVKNAVRMTLPDLDLEAEEVHFDPDESTLAMIAKIPKTIYLVNLNHEIKKLLTEQLIEDKDVPGIKEILEYILEKLTELSDEPPIYETVRDALQKMKNFDVSKTDNVNGRIHLNDVIRKAITTIFPRVGLDEAKCCMDKEKPTSIMIMKIPLSDETLELYDEIREDVQTEFETIENDPDVHVIMHDVLVELNQQPSQPEDVLCVYDSVAVNIKQQNKPRLALLTAKTLFYRAVRKCIEIVFPLLDISDDDVIDKEFPIVQMFRQIPDSTNVELIEEIIKQLEENNKDAEDSVKPLVNRFIECLSERTLLTGAIDGVYPCIKKIKDSQEPIKDFKVFMELVYDSIKKAIQEIYPDIELQDNQSAWETEAEILLLAQKLPETDDSSPMIDQIRERLEIIRSSEELSSGLKRILQEVEHHLTVMPLDDKGYEHMVDAILSVLRARKGEAKDLALARTHVFQILRQIMEVVRLEGEDKSEDAAPKKKTKFEDEQSDEKE